jgi:uncharacterized damage-inducible protein DinB
MPAKRGGKKSASKVSASSRATSKKSTAKKKTGRKRSTPGIAKQAKKAASTAVGTATGASRSLMAAVVITPEALLEHWQGHRRLTRRVIEAFPEDRLFTFSVGSMRPFGALALEMLSMALPMIRGIVTGDWDQSITREPRPREEILRLWDESTKQIDALWRQIPRQRFQETTTAFGQYEGRVYDLLFYVIDNEIHHRGQGYVYLRALGIEPPPFYERQ